MYLGKMTKWNQISVEFQYHRPVFVIFLWNHSLERERWCYFTQRVGEFGNQFDRLPQWWLYIIENVYENQSYSQHNKQHGRLVEAPKNINDAWHDNIILKTLF